MVATADQPALARHPALFPCRQDRLVAANPPRSGARLMPAKYVRPYSKGQKNDFRDAEAITEAVQRPIFQHVGE
jgi:hypothetical protein